jgi:hypothetical protein
LLCGVPIPLRLTAPSTITPAQHRAHELQEVAVDDPFLERRHQPVVRDRLITVGDVRVKSPLRAATTPESRRRNACGRLFLLRRARPRIR